MADPSPESSLDLRLARRIESLRRERGLSLDEMAAASGVSRATVSRIERGETSPTAHVLGRLCAAFGMTLSELLLGAEGSAPALVPRAAAPVWVDPDTGFRRTVLSPPAPGYAVEIMEGALPPGARIAYPRPPLAGLEHHVLMLSGRLVLTLDGRPHDLGPGDCLRYRLTGPSAFENPGAEPGLYLVVVRKPS